MSDTSLDTDVDPATIEVVRHYLTSAANEMERTLVRTAYSTIIYEIKDFGLSIYDKNLDLIANSTGLALFLGANDYAIRESINLIDEDELQPGDVVIMNVPYLSGAHSNDAVLFSPVFYNGEIVSYAVSRGHWTDIGGKDPGYILDSNSIHQEGMLLPGVKLYKGGEPDEELLKILRANSRSPEIIMGDFKAQVAAIRAGRERVQELYEKYGKSVIESCIDQILAHGRRSAKEAVQGLPTGSWTGENYIDNDGINDELIKIGVDVSIDDEEFVVDFSDSDDEVDGPVNLSLGMTKSACQICFKSVTTPDEPPNAGHYEPLRVEVPEGNLFNAEYPAPVFTIWAGVLAIDAIYQALAKAMPDRVPASSGGDLGDPGFYGKEPITGRQVWHQTNAGVGWGATRGSDGLNATHHISMSAVKNIPVEVIESRLPVMVEQAELRTDSGGPGKYRGGLGSRRDYRFLDSFGALTIVKKTKTGGWGINGGESGKKNVGVIYPNTAVEDWEEHWQRNVTVYADNDSMYDNDDKAKKYAGMFRGTFQPGDRISYLAGGGGGYGDPLERDPERVREDVVDGYVTREHARERYGVEITANDEVDWNATQKLREEADRE